MYLSLPDRSLFHAGRAEQLCAQSPTNDDRKRTMRCTKAPHPWDSPKQSLTDCHGHTQTRREGDTEPEVHTDVRGGPRERDYPPRSKDC